MLLPAYRLINPQANRSFVLKPERFDLNTRWHYHPEIELILFTEGKTTAVIGDGFQQFAKGDLVIIGANLPHVLKEDPVFKSQHPTVDPSGVIVQFTENFLGADFFTKPEMHAVKHMLDKARRGIKFPASIAEDVHHSLTSIHLLPETRKLILLLDILVTLAESDHTEFLTTNDYSYDHIQDEARMHAINQYVYEHFRENIDIHTIAAVASMTETSFCRYFRTRTLKTFTRFLNEIRVGYASKLLNRPDYSITEVCFECGFNNLSYFNRQFKSMMKMSPMQYRKWKLTAAV